MGAGPRVLRPLALLGLWLALTAGGDIDDYASFSGSGPIHEGGFASVTVTFSAAAIDETVGSSLSVIPSPIDGPIDPAGTRMTVTDERGAVMDFPEQFLVPQPHDTVCDGNGDCVISVTIIGLDPSYHTLLVGAELEGGAGIGCTERHFSDGATVTFSFE